MKEPTSTQHELAFSDLSPDDFERLVHFILEDSEEFFDVTRYGGVRDRGRDIVAIKQGGNKKEKWYFQCKRYKEISSVDLIPELEKICEPS